MTHRTEKKTLMIWSSVQDISQIYKLWCRDDGKLIELEMIKENLH